MRWQKQVFIHTRLSRAYLALTRLSCNIWRRHRYDQKQSTNCGFFSHWLLDRIQLVQILYCWAMVVCCAVKTQYVASFGRQSNGPDGLSFPIGVTVCKDGKVVVCDTRSNTVKMFNSDGSVLRVIDRSVRWVLSYAATLLHVNYWKPAVLVRLTYWLISQPDLHQSLPNVNK